MLIEPRGRRMHVLSLVDNLGTMEGGAERMARELAARIDQERFRSTLCVTRFREVDQTIAGKSIVRTLETRGVRVILLGRRSRMQVSPWLRLLRYIRQEKVSILHGHSFGSNVWASILGPLARVPVSVSHEHGWSYEGEPIRRVLDRVLVARSCDAMISSSELARRKMIDVERIDPDRTRLIYLRNGIAEPTLAGRSVRAELAIPPEAPVVTAIARLDQYKSLHVLIDAAAQLISRFPNLRVLVAGEGPERAKLEARIASLRLESVVALLGSRADAPDVINACDVATLCSYSETTPLAIMEYMALGKPVVATRVGGIPDLVEHGVHGLLVEPHDPTALAGAITKVLQSPDRGAAMGALGRERQEREFSIDAVARRVESLYDELLRNHSTVRRR